MTVIQNQKDDREVIKGKHVLIGFIVFFGIIFSVNFLMAWYAGNTWTGLVVPNSYVASQHYNERLATAREQKARGWKAATGYKENQIVLELMDKQGKAVKLDRVTAKIGHPVHERDDQTIELIYRGNGLYTGEVKLPRGDWLIAIDGNSADLPFHLENRISVKE